MTRSVEDTNSTAAVGAQQSRPANGPAGGVPSPQPRSHTASAYTLAMANIHKPWARRWLNANGYRWATGIYRERQKQNRTDEERS